jgi:hypothetical protein
LPWSETDQTYGAMADTCESTTNCTLDLNGKGEKSVYIGCIDTATNYSQPNYNLTYYIDVDPTSSLLTPARPLLTALL